MVIKFSKETTQRLANTGRNMVRASEAFAKSVYRAVNAFKDFERACASLQKIRK